MREDVAWSHELWQPAGPRSPARVRAFVAEHLLAHGRSHLVEPVRLVASELATNAILHSGSQFTVTLLEEQGTVMLSVEDDRPHLWPSLGVASATAEGGRGLWLVEVLSEDWGVKTDRRGSKAVWASLAAGLAAKDGTRLGRSARHPPRGGAAGPGGGGAGKRVLG